MMGEVREGALVVGKKSVYVNGVDEKSMMGGEESEGLGGGKSRKGSVSWVWGNGELKKRCKGNKR